MGRHFHLAMPCGHLAIGLSGRRARPGAFGGLRNAAAGFGEGRPFDYPAEVRRVRTAAAEMQKGALSDAPRKLDTAVDYLTAGAMRRLFVLDVPLAFAAAVFDLPVVRVLPVLRLAAI